MISDVDYNAILESLNNKVDIDGLNAKPSVWSETPLLCSRVFERSLVGDESLGWLLAGNNANGLTYTSTWAELQNVINTGASYKNYQIDNFIKVGTPTVSNGVASGFSASTTITFPKHFRAGNNPFEFGVKFITGETVANDTIISCGHDGSPISQAFVVRLINGKLATWLCSANTDNWNIVAGTSGSFNFQPNTQYYLKFRWTGTQYIYSYSIDGRVFTDDIIITSSVPLNNETDTYPIFGAYWTNKSNLESTTYFRGSIDISESYLKINGIIDWSTHYFPYKTLNGVNVVDYTYKAQVDALYTSQQDAPYWLVDNTSNTFYAPRFNHGELVYSFYIGSNWWRLYEDGWLEQGGDGATANTGVGTVTLHKSFIGNYIPIISAIHGAYAISPWFVKVCDPRTSSSFGVSCNVADIVGFKWQASGYADMSQFPEITNRLRLTYFRIGNTIVNQSTIDVATLTTEVNSLQNGKASVNLDNLTTAGATSIAEASSIDISRGFELVNQNNWQAVWVNPLITPSVGYLMVFTAAASHCHFSINEQSTSQQSTGEQNTSWIPVPKGASLVRQTSYGTWTIGFFPLKGA